MRGVRRGLMLLATGAIVAAAAATASAAQQPPRMPQGARVQPLGQNNGAELRRNLTILADNPRSLDALIGAGRAALEMGDAEAALSFFGRADELSPRNARVRAGMASALVQLGRPQPALQLFAEAVTLGAPEVEIAGDRGLAFDMVGDPRRAQQDYALVLRRRDHPETRRRMALSLAISGQREAALRLIDGQLRSNDRAGWRTQALVLALTGDAEGANRTAQGTMPAGAAQAMAPFLARLAHLSPAQKAMAVHFGHFPSDGRSAAAATDATADPGAVAMAMGGSPPAAAPRVRPAEPVQTADRRRPRSAEPARAAPRRRADRTDSSDPYGLRSASPPARRTAPPSPAQRTPVEVARTDVRRVTPTPQSSAPRPQPPVPQSRPQPEPPPVQPAAPGPDPAPPPPAPATGATAGGEPGGIVMTAVPPSTPPPETPSAGPPSASAPIVATPIPPSAPAAEPVPGASPGFTLSEPSPLTTASTASGRAPLSDIASIVNALPQEQDPVPAAASPPPAPARPTPVRSAQAPASAPARARAAAPAHPSRHWVQIATLPERAALAREFARLRGRAAEALGRRAAYAAPYGRSSSRLLVGPFATAREAQEFVNRLAQSQVAAFAWTSDAGQEIERLSTGR